MTQAVSLVPLSGLPLFEPGDDLAQIILSALRKGEIGLRDGDIVVLAQKIVSKVEDCYIDVADMQPSAEALALAHSTGKDPRHVEAILSESTEVVKVGPNVIVVAHRLGFVMANAGIDESNIDHGPRGRRLLALPKDPDGSAESLRQEFQAAFGIRCGVVISDSFGRPWRNGVVGVAIGAAGVSSLTSKIGALDLFGRRLEVTEIATADEIASAASILMGQAGEGIPVVIVRGLPLAEAPTPALQLVRDPARDMFR